MNKDISDRKLHIYTILLYMMMPLAEIYLNLFIYATNQSKVSLTFAAKIKEALNLIKFDIILYLLALFLIYFIFALINTKMVLYAYRAMGKNRFSARWPVKGLLFIVVNGYFFMTLYYLNATFYPFSKISKFAKIVFKPEYHRLYFFSALALLAIYLLSLITVYLRFGSRTSKTLLLIFLGVLLLSHLDPGYQLKRTFSLTAGKNSNTGPNVIIIGIDSLNPLHTGYFEYPHDTTPHLDEFLKSCVVFTKAYTPLARTSASWYSILTGQHPKTNGMRYNLMSRRYLNPESTTITSYLKDHEGYHNAHFTDETRFCNLIKQDGFQDMGHPVTGIRDFLFGTIHDFSITNIFFNNPLGYRLFKFLDINRAVYHLYRPEYFSNRVTGYLSSLKTRERFFLVTHHCAPHWPYQAPYPYPYLFNDDPDNEYSLYDGVLRMADDQFGRLMASIKANGFYDNSLIIVLSDHGETAKGHGVDLKDPGQNRILLAMKAPRQSRHAEIVDPVRTIDLAPTILDVLGIPHRNLTFDGTSFEPWLRNQDQSSGGNRPVIMETGFSIDVPGGVDLGYQELLNQGVTFYKFNEHGIITVKEDLHQDLIDRKQRAIQTREWKLVLSPETRMRDGGESISLYSLAVDPECENNVAEEHPDITADLMKRLREFYGEELGREDV